MTAPVLELERETIARLQAAVKEKDTEIQALTAKISELEIEKNVLQSEKKRKLRFLF